MNRSRLAESLSRVIARASSSRSSLALALIAALAVIPGSAHALIDRCSACAPPGWTAPVVPRTTGDAVDSIAFAVPLSPVLVGGGTTFLNWAACGNEAAQGGWTDQLSLDGEPIETLVRPVDPRWITHYFRAVNQGPTIIRGGRHTLRDSVDIYYRSGEGIGSRGDNVWYGQWVWSPIALPWSPTGYWRVAPPQRGPGAIPNSDGLAFTRPGGYPWCVAIAIAGAADNDLVLYDDYVDATSGFSHALATSACGADSTELVVGHDAGTPLTFYPGIVSGVTAAANYCVLSVADATSHTGTATSTWSNVLLYGYHVADVYRVHLDAGQSVGMTVTRTGGTSTLALAVFPAGSGGVYSRRQALAASTSQDAQMATLNFAPPATGEYPVVVFRASLAGATENANYTLALGQPLAVPEPTLSLELLGASPNPVRGASRLAFSLPAAGHVTLALHDVQGRRVRTLVDAALPAGSHAVSWDGRDDAGARVPAGSYWMKLVTADGTRSRPLIVTR